MLDPDGPCSHPASAAAPSVDLTQASWPLGDKRCQTRQTRSCPASVHAGAGGQAAIKEAISYGELC